MLQRLCVLARVATLACVVLTYVLILRGWASAQTRAERDLALAIAKVAANESSLSTIRPADVALIHQTAQTHGSTPRAQLRWLRAHSSCVLGDRDLATLARPGNCAWTRTLTDSDARPEGWRQSYPHLRWARYVERWRQVRIVARRLVTGALVMRPCPRAPWTWGSVRLDTRRALARGLVPLGCRDPQTGEALANDGFARAAAESGSTSAAEGGLR